MSAVSSSTFASDSNLDSDEEVVLPPSNVSRIANGARTNGARNTAVVTRGKPNIHGYNSATQPSLSPVSRAGSDLRMTWEENRSSAGEFKAQDASAPEEARPSLLVRLLDKVAASVPLPVLVSGGLGILFLARLIVAAVLYSDDLQNRIPRTNRSVIDSPHLWVLVSSAILCLVLAAHVISALTGRFVVEMGIATYIQFSVSIGCITLIESLTAGAHIVLAIAPILGQLANVDVRVRMLSWAINVCVVLIATVIRYYVPRGAFALDDQPWFTFAAYCIMSLAMLMLPHMGAARQGASERQKYADSTFVMEVIQLLSELNVTAAKRRLDSQSRKGGTGSCDAVFEALNTLTDRLTHFRAFVPAAVLLDKFDEDNEDAESENTAVQDEGFTHRNAEEMLESVEKSQFKRRWSTVMHIYIANQATDVLLADRIAHRVTEAIIPKIIAYRGVIDYLSPNRILASFNCHLPCVIHESEACNCALAIAADLSQYTEILFSIAISSGYNLTGTCGNDSHRAKVVIGEAVDVALKIPLLALTHLGCKIVITEDTASKIGFEVAPIDNIQPRWPGRSERTIMLYELRSARKENAPAALTTLYTSAFSTFRSGSYEAAMVLWRSYCEKNPHDLQAQRLMAICDALLNDPVARARTRFYVRRDLLWEGFEGERKILAVLMAQGYGPVFGVDYAAASPVASPRMVGDQVRAQFLNNQRLDFQEDGLFSMFVAQDEDGDGDDPSNGDVPGAPVDEAQQNNNNIAALSSAVPRNFEDASKNRWQRSAKEIGEGAFSEVYLALEEHGNLVAAKCFSLASTRTNQEELVTEVNTLSNFRNDYIVGYVSYALTPNHFIILMEYVSGGSLYKLLHQFGPLSQLAARRYLTDILKGLRYLHERHTTHCDIKPHNVLLSNDGMCKLTDFGSSVCAVTVSQERSEEALLVRGTSWYLAPEAARGEIAPSNDIWSIGITLIEMLTGKQPWEYKGSEATFIANLGKDPTFVPPVATNITGSARSFIEACLQRDVEKRPTVEQLLAHPFIIAGS